MNLPFNLLLVIFTVNASLTIYSNFVQKRKIDNLEMVVGELSERTERLLNQNEQLLSLYLQQNKELLSLLEKKGLRDVRQDSNHN